jgi:hypothetical protein
MYDQRSASLGGLVHDRDEQIKLGATTNETPRGDRGGGRDRSFDARSRIRSSMHDTSLRVPTVQRNAAGYIVLLGVTRAPAG